MKISQRQECHVAYEETSICHLIILCEIKLNQWCNMKTNDCNAFEQETTKNLETTKK